MARHVGSLLSKVGAFPRMNSEDFALVRATFIRRSSTENEDRILNTAYNIPAKKPTDCTPGPARTQDKMITSFS